MVERENDRLDDTTLALQTMFGAILERSLACPGVAGASIAAFQPCRGRLTPVTAVSHGPNGGSSTWSRLLAECAARWEPSGSREPEHIFEGPSQSSSLRVFGAWTTGRRADGLQVLHLLTTSGGAGADGAVHRTGARVTSALDAYEVYRFSASRGRPIGYLGLSDRFDELRQDARRIGADSQCPVLITGERGAGKEAVAHAIHYHSVRRMAPFVTVNSAALHPDLCTVELFGCRRGAFTGADADRIGRFEAAEGGTLFFDEITEMPARLSVMLLRAIEYGEVQKVGDPSARRVDVRVIAATNRDVLALVKSGRFPADLYDRLTAVTIHAPALRERPSDVPLLGAYFARKHCPRRHPSSPTSCSRCVERGVPDCLAGATLARMRDYHWPGNVRELQNAAIQFLLRGDWRPASPGSAVALVRDLTTRRDLGSLLRDHILGTLNAVAWNKSAAARDLGIPLSTLVSKMKRLGIPPRPVERR